jgi:lipoic acid synthetase
VTLRVRWLSRVPYREALDLQTALFERGSEQHLLLLEHLHVFTHGAGADLERNVLVDPSSVGAELVAVNRGGDVTYHGPGQLVGYPIVTLTPKWGRGASGLADSVAYVSSVEQLLIDSLADLGLRNTGRLRGFPGVWVDPASDTPRKIAAIGVRLTRGRTMHGFALNIDPDLRYLREYIVPCGIPDKAVTSLAAEGLHPSMQHVVDVIAARAARLWGENNMERQDVAWRHDRSGMDLSPFSRGEGPGHAVRDAGDHFQSPRRAEVKGQPVRLLGRLERAGLDTGLAVSERKPEWLRPKVRIGAEVLTVQSTLRDLGLVTVCEEAGCPNLSECWADGTATFMVLGERCTRACGFCLVDTRKPEPARDDEPARVAEAVARMGLAHAVITMVARDDLPDGGAQHVVETIHAIRSRTPGVAVEVLVSDFHGNHDAADAVIAARPDVFNHNTETVPRLQRAVRPSAGYARSLSLLSRARTAGVRTKSGLIVGMGETDEEVIGVLADLASIGCSIVTIGQYLRPTSHHLPVQRWVTPATFDEYRRVGLAYGLDHVEASPLTRSSYHAREAADSGSPS